MLLLTMSFDSNTQPFFFANACSCTPGATLFDEALDLSSSIFEAEFIDTTQKSWSDRSTNGDNYYNTFHVSKVWKGIPQAGHNFTVQTDPDSLCGYEFGNIGSKYLVYTLGSQRIESWEKVDICGRTRPINHDEAISDMNAMKNNEIKIARRKLEKCGTSGKGGKGKGGKGGKRDNRRTTDCDDEPLDGTPSSNPSSSPDNIASSVPSKYSSNSPSQSPSLDDTKSPSSSPSNNSPPVLLLDSADKRSNDCQELVDSGLLDPSLCTGNGADQYLQNVNQQPRLRNGLFFQTDTNDDSHNINGPVRRRHLRRSSQSFRSV